MADLSEQPATASTTEIYVDVVVLAAHGLLDEGLFHDLPVYDDRIAILAQADFRCDLESAERDADLLFHDIAQLIVHFRTTIAGDL